jgi:malate dehydrogenase
MGKKRIGLIGGGQIGGNLALLAVQKDLGDVILYDIPAAEGLVKGKALDINQLAAVDGYEARVTATTDWKDVAGADVVIITAGIPRRPGMSREDLLETNLKIMKDVASNLKAHCPQAFVINVANPLDAMVYALQKITGFPRTHVVGMAGVLDTARFKSFVAEAVGCSPKDVQALVLGGHGDDMVPVLSMTTVNGIPVSSLIAKDKLDKIVERTRKGGGEIVNLMGTSAYYAPASSAVSMVKAYLRDEKRLLACASYLDGEYGYRDLFMGVPTIIGGGGVEKIVDIPLSDEEKAMLAKSAKSVQTVVDLCKKG